MTAMTVREFLGLPTGIEEALDWKMCMIERSGKRMDIGHVAFCEWAQFLARQFRHDVRFFYSLRADGHWAGLARRTGQQNAAVDAALARRDYAVGVMKENIRQQGERMLRREAIAYEEPGTYMCMPSMESFLQAWRAHEKYGTVSMRSDLCQHDDALFVWRHVSETPRSPAALCWRLGIDQWCGENGAGHGRVYVDYDCDNREYLYIVSLDNLEFVESVTDEEIASLGRAMLTAAVQKRLASSRTAAALAPEAVEAELAHLLFDTKTDDFEFEVDVKRDAKRIARALKHATKERRDGHAQIGSSYRYA